MPGGGWNNRCFAEPRVCSSTYARESRLPSQLQQQQHLSSDLPQRLRGLRRRLDACPGDRGKTDCMIPPLPSEKQGRAGPAWGQDLVGGQVAGPRPRQRQHNLVLRLCDGFSLFPPPFQGPNLLAHWGIVGDLVDPRQMCPQGMEVAEPGLEEHLLSLSYCCRPLC